MSFEDDFPSLKGKIDEYEIKERIPKSEGYFNQPGIWFDVMKKDIQEFCLDKQKVKDAVKNLGLKYDKYNELSWQDIVDFEKELGL